MDVEKSLTISVKSDVSGNVPTAIRWTINKTLTCNPFHKHLYNKLGTHPIYNELKITPNENYSDLQKSDPYSFILLHDIIGGDMLCMMYLEDAHPVFGVGRDVRG